MDEIQHGKIIINLNDKDDVTAAIKGKDYWLCLWDISQYLRSEIKYNEKLTKKEYTILYNIRNKFYEILEEHNASIEDIS